MLIGIFMHASHTYGEGFQDIWYITEHSRSYAFTIGFFFLHLFRMPVFFFVAGFFANYLAHKNGIKGFIKNRMFRIGVPFAVFFPITLLGVMVLIAGSVLYLPEDSYGPVQRQVVEIRHASLRSRMRATPVVPGVRRYRTRDGF